MSFAEINLFGVYVAPISLMMIGAWFVTIGLRLGTDTACCDTSGIQLSLSLPFTSSFFRPGYCLSRGGHHDRY
jgi:hypothetical protein